MSQESKLKKKDEPRKGLTTFQLGMKDQPKSNYQPESELAESQQGSNKPTSDKSNEQESAPDTSPALARLAALARDGSEADRSEGVDDPPSSDPSPQAIIDDPDYTSTFNILNGLKGRSAKGDFSKLEIGSSGVDLTSASDRIFDTTWNQAKKAVKSPTKSVRVKKLLAALDEGDPTKRIIPSVSITPDEPMCNFIYQSASAPYIDAFTGKISNPSDGRGANLSNTLTNNK